MADLGPARVGLASAADLLHPELALALAKRGCDLVAAGGGRLSPEERDVLSFRSLERITLALAWRGGGLVSSPPEGHEAASRLEVMGTGIVSRSLDTRRTRAKGYEERLDYQTLLESGEEEIP